MRELKNGIKIIGVDTGYGNIKTSSTVTKSAITVYDTEPIFSGNVLEYDGKYYRFGEGHKSFIADKTSDEDFYMFTLMAIAKELGRAGIYAADVYLAESLPLTWVRVQRESSKSYLMKNKSVDFKFNGKEYHIKFVGCSVYPQAYPAVIERIGEFKGVNILADIGNGTLNVPDCAGRRADSNDLPQTGRTCGTWHSDHESGSDGRRACRSQCKGGPDAKLPHGRYIHWRRAGPRRKGNRV